MVDDKLDRIQRFLINQSHSMACSPSNDAGFKKKVL